MCGKWRHQMIKNRQQGRKAREQKQTKQSLKSNEYDRFVVQQQS